MFPHSCPLTRYFNSNGEKAHHVWSQQIINFNGKIILLSLFVKSSLLGNYARSAKRPADQPTDRPIDRRPTDQRTVRPGHRKATLFFRKTYIVKYRLFFSVRAFPYTTILFQAYCLTFFSLKLFMNLSFHDFVCLISFHALCAIIHCYILHWLLSMLCCSAYHLIYIHIYMYIFFFYQNKNKFLVKSVKNNNNNNWVSPFLFRWLFV